MEPPWIIPSPTPAETVNQVPDGDLASQVSDGTWKTYGNEEYGFEFQYPADWSVGLNLVFGSQSTVEFDYNYGKPLYLHYYGNYNQVTGQPYKTLQEYVSGRSTETRVIQDRIISNHYAVYRKSEGKEGRLLPFEEVFLFTPDKRAIINLYFQPDYYDKAAQSNTFDQILSTFSFLGET